MGRKDGKEVYRITYLIRVPNYCIGDFVIINNRISRMSIAHEYTRLAGDPAIAETIFNKIRNEYNRTLVQVLNVSGQKQLMEESPALGLSMYRRNPYLDPLNNIQITLLSRYRSESLGKEVRERLGERMGQANVPRPDKTLLWFHAASVGETNTILPLIEELCSKRPDISVLLTTVTVTSASIAASRLPEGAIHQFVPLDSPSFVTRFLNHWRPDMALFTESEIWPNLILEADKRGIPLALLNATMSERSFRG